MAEKQTVGAAMGSILPRVTIQFCTQCKWMLRAAYYAQELLSTFSTSLGEVALQPSTGGTFIVTIYHHSTESASAAGTSPSPRILWNRKTDGGFPETKELKRRVRDVIEPERNLGHVDRDYSKKGEGTEKSEMSVVKGPVAKTTDGAQGKSCEVIGSGEKCEDCN